MAEDKQWDAWFNEQYELTDAVRRAVRKQLTDKTPAFRAAVLAGLLESVAEDIRSDIEIHAPVMSDQEYRDFMDLMMVSDPWPLAEEQNDSLIALADTEARRRGYDSWIVAYHEHMKAKE